MWTCQTCHRSFKNKNQDHSCRVIPLREHFRGKPVELEKIVMKILEEVQSFGEVQVSSVKSAILVAVESTFLALKVKKDRVDIEFVLDEELDGFPVYKVFRVSKNRMAHFVTVGNIEEVDDHLLGLIRQAYGVVTC